MYGSILNWFIVLILVLFVAVRFGGCDSAEYPEYHQEYQGDGQILEEEYLPPHELHSHLTTPPCCASPTVDNIDYLIISTMDGNLQALDIRDGGEVAWQMNLDDEPLMWGTLGRIQPLISPEGDTYELVPALDGSLFKYSERQRLLEPLPLNADMLLQASFRIGHDAIAGGRSVTTTGIDPISGKIRYHCSSVNCDAMDSEEADIQATLVFRRSTSTIRAVNALSGAERWNLSVSEYEAHLVLISQSTVVGQKSLVTFLIRPPEGIITALNSCGEEMWTKKLGSHIAKTWHLDAGQLNEISVLDGGAEVPKQPEEQENLAEPMTRQLARTETMFYLGTLNDEPFIIQSSKTKQELQRMIAGMELERVSQARNQLVSINSGAYHMDNTLDDILGSRNRRPRDLEGNQENQNDDEKSKQIALMQERHLAVARNQRERDERSTFREACPNSDGLSFIGEQDIRNAALEMSELGDQGWYIMCPSADGRVTGNSWFGRRQFNARCQAQFSDKMSKVFRLDETVSAWWRVIALGLSGFLVPIFIMIYRKWRRRNKVNRDFARQQSDISRKSHETKTTSCGPSIVGDKSGPESSLKESEKTIGTLLSERTSASSQNSITEPEYQSKFLTEFEPVKLLGHGGFGLVFEAINHLDTAHYAVKRIAVAKNKNDIERVLREVRAMAKLDHPNIIRYHYNWIEEPPPGWQEEKDKELFRRILTKSKRREIREDQKAAQEETEATNLSSDKENRYRTPVVKDSESSFDVGPKFEEPSLGKIDNPDDSWNGNDNLEDTESTSTEDSGEHDVKFGLQDREDSESIIFEKSVKCEESSRPSSSDLALKASRGDMNVDDVMLMTSRDQHEDVIPAAKQKCTNVAYVFIQMQLCQENTLHSWLTRHTNPEDRPLLKMKLWMQQLCSAISYIHSMRLIHRDLKPQNIFFGSNGSMKIGDLGLVTKNMTALDPSQDSEAPDDAVTSGDLNQTNQAGTRVYMSPEMLDEKPYTFKVDVFSLGLIFCELVVPFKTTMERYRTLENLQRDLDCEVLKDKPMEVWPNIRP
ncbi:hypothetical protein WR25_20629 isoform B [Diploscapter pachys]|uniref:PRKR-like endoplasmic reticulum kinase n=2 Tax=Diploscapter pachys TaxID=2018661 RepID=A0A2A2KZG8_9BILA|nr:hypothetical protein WR25_20629 isoform B [Diploscapter pachys]